MWPAFPAVALVDQHDAIPRHVEELEVIGTAAGPGPAVDDERRDPLAVGFPVDLVAVADVQQAAHGRLRRAHRFSSSWETTGSLTEAAKLSAPAAKTFAPAGVS